MKQSDVRLKYSSIYRLTLIIVIPSSPLKMEMVCLSFMEKAYQKLFHHICYGLSLSFEEPLINTMYTILFKKKEKKMEMMLNFRENKEITCLLTCD